MIRSAHIIEPLEQRIAPASLVDPRTIIYTDGDGDSVTVKFSFDVFGGDSAAALAKANEVFKFSVGAVGDQSTAQVLQRIDFTKFPVIANKGSTVNGVGMTVTSTIGAGGDGFVDVGAIKAVGVSLGKIIIDGDIGQIDAGGSGLKIGIASLTVKSIGMRGTGTQVPVPSPTAENPAPDLVSTITGEVTKLTVLEDIKDARIRIADGRNTQNQLTTLAKLGTLFVGASIFGKTAAEAASDETGVIDCDRDITSARIGTDLSHGIFGGGGVNSGRIRAGGMIKSLTISGDVTGGAGVRSGSIAAGAGFGSVFIGDDLTGGAGADSGSILSLGNFASLTIRDNLTAGTGLDSAVVRSLGAISKVLINGNLDGTLASSGANSAGIFANGLPSIIIKGGIFGGPGAGTAFIHSGRSIGSLTVNFALSGGGGDGSGVIVADGPATSILIGGKILGSAGIQSGAVRVGIDALQSGTLASISVLGGIEGGTGAASGSVASGGNITTAKIGTAANQPADVLKGGEGRVSGTISANGKIGSATLFGSVIGGIGQQSGGIFATERSDARLDEVPGSIGTLKISGSLTGGSGPQSGRIAIDGGIALLTVAAVTGGTGIESGSVRTGLGIFGNGDITAMSITTSIAAASSNGGADSASIVAGGRMVALSIGSNLTEGAIRAADSIGKLTIGGNVESGIITARGAVVQTTTTDLAISSITIKGNVANSQILAGYSVSDAGVNPDAQIGSVTVIGNWTASSIAAGVAKGGADGFGDPLNVKASGPDSATIVSRIASISIAGTATASGASTIHAFTAQHIVKMKVGSAVLAFDATPGNQSLEVGGAASNLVAREIPVVA